MGEFICGPISLSILETRNQQERAKATLIQGMVTLALSHDIIVVCIANDQLQMYILEDEL